jgi:hypothetical protein
MGCGAARFVCVVGAISGATGFIVRVTARLRIAAIGTPVATNAPLTVEVLFTEATALIAIFLESIGGRAQGVRRSPHGVGETALKMALAHLLPSENRSLQKFKTV